MMEFKVSSYLYLHHEDYTNENLEKEANTILNNAFKEYSILSVENRNEYKETAVSFDTFIQAENKEKAEQSFLLSLKGYDVDNYNIQAN